MITTVTLNPCIDRTIELQNLTVGSYNLVDRVWQDISGKGINVSVALHQLGLSTQALGFSFDRDGDPVRPFLEQRHIPFHAVSLPQPLRINLKLTDTASHILTEVNERGGQVQATHVEAVLDLLRTFLPGTKILVISGSVPPGVPHTIYRDMIEMARTAGVPSVLDASGALLQAGIEAAPWMVKPNTLELESYFGQAVTSREQALSLAAKLLDQGVENICLSMGKDGAALLTKEGGWFSGGLDITVRGMQGAGDSMVAGLCVAALEGLSPCEQLRYAVSAAHGSLLRPGTQLCTSDLFRKMLAQMPVERIK